MDAQHLGVTPESWEGGEGSSSSCIPPSGMGSQELVVNAAFGAIFRAGVEVIMLLL